METIEEMQAKHEKALARLKHEHAIASLAPLPPKSVQISSRSLGHWVSYKCANLWEAIDLMGQFEPITFYEYKKTFTRFVPSALNIADKDLGEEKSGPYVAKIDVSQGEGFGPTVDFCFFTRLGDEICMIRIDLEGEYYHNSFYQYGANFNANPRGMSRRLEGQRYIPGDFVQNSKLSAHMDKVTKWGSGSQEAAQFGYAIMADSEGENDLAEYTDAKLRLENLAEAMHGERK